MSTQLEPETASVPASKGIFISYSRRDKAWVDDYLKPLLKAAEVEIAVDDEDFKCGDPLEATIRKFIEESRYMLLVMTPDWVNGKWTHFEGLLAGGGGTDVKLRRVLPLMLKTCTIPPHIVPLVYKDLCNIDERDEKMVELLRELQVSEGCIAKAQLSIAKKTLQLLIELMEEREVRDRVSALRQRFEQVEERNSIVESNKTLHDMLQDIQLMVKQVSHDSQRLLLNDDRWWEARAGTSALRRQLKKLLAYAATVKLDPEELAFVVPFSHLVEDVYEASKSGDADRFAMIVGEICSEVDISLPVINDRIISNIKERPLETLIESLEIVYDRVATFDFDEPASALLREYKCGIEKLVELDNTIQLMIADHAMLQRTEVKLHLMCKSGDPTFHQISGTWRYVEPAVRKLKLADRYQALLASRDELNVLLDDRESVRDDSFMRKVTTAFHGFVEEANFAFNELDVELLALCRKLVPHGDELRNIIRRMQNHENNI